jgi:aspartate-semialdehyde dehydrogenase
VSGAGRSAVEDLAKQTADLMNGREVETEGDAKQVAFNAIPHIDSFQDNGYTREEMKMVWETRKIFGDDRIQVNPTAVRIPAFFGHSEAVHIETREKISAERVRELLQDAPGVVVIDDACLGGYPTAATDAAGKDAVFVGRIREDISHEQGISLWVVSDNVRKGAALNTVQIAEILEREYL